MPYKVGEKDSYGCSGYPAVKDDGEVMGCHKTRSQAAAQIYAINISEGNIGKSMPNLNEGDFAMTAHGSDEDVHIGQVVHVMREGMLGVPGGEYTLEASAENPAVLLQLFEQEENGYWEATNLYTGCMMSLMVAIDPLPQEPEDSEVAMAMYDAQVGKAEKPNYEDMIKPRSGGSEPANTRLYTRILSEAKDRFDVYPSAVANAWVVAEYKRRGGTYKSENQVKADGFWKGFLK